MYKHSTILVCLLICLLRSSSWRTAPQQVILTKNALSRSKSKEVRSRNHTATTTIRPDSQEHPALSSYHVFLDVYPVKKLASGLPKNGTKPFDLDLAGHELMKDMHARYPCLDFDEAVNLERQIHQKEPPQWNLPHDRYQAAHYVHLVYHSELTFVPDKAFKRLGTNMSHLKRGEEFKSWKECEAVGLTVSFGAFCGKDPEFLEEIKAPEVDIKKARTWIKAKKVDAGTVLVCNDAKAKIFTSLLGSQVAYTVIRKGGTVEAIGKPQERNGYMMVPIKQPKGLVRLDLFDIVEEAGRQNTSKDPAHNIDDPYYMQGSGIKVTSKPLSWARPMMPRWRTGAWKYYYGTVDYDPSDLENTGILKHIVNMVEHSAKRKAGLLPWKAKKEKAQWSAYAYNLQFYNCVSFSEALLQWLHLGEIKRGHVGWSKALINKIKFT